MIVETSAVADRGYATLAGVNLGADAATLHTGGDESASARMLGVALRAHPSDALVLQGWPLRAATLAALGAPPVAEPLRAAWAAALAAVAPSAPTTSDTAVARDLHTRLPALLDALWSPLGAAPPPLRVLDCAPLGAHGRAAMVDGVFTVATSFAVGRDHPLLQVFHEAAHPVTDPAVFARLESRAEAPRDTRRDSPGFAAHRACEAAAVAWGTAVLERAAPDLLPAWAAWRARWGA